MPRLGRPGRSSPLWTTGGGHPPRPQINQPKTSPNSKATKTPAASGTYPAKRNPIIAPDTAHATRPKIAAEGPSSMRPPPPGRLDSIEEYSSLNVVLKISLRGIPVLVGLRMNHTILRPPFNSVARASSHAVTKSEHSAASQISLRHVSCDMYVRTFSDRLTTLLPLLVTWLPTLLACRRRLGGDAHGTQG